MHRALETRIGASTVIATYRCGTSSEGSVVADVAIGVWVLVWINACKRSTPVPVKEQHAERAGATQHARASSHKHWSALSKGLPARDPMAAHTHNFDGDIVHLFETRAFASLSISTQRAITGWRVGRRQLVAAGIDGFEGKFRCFEPRARGKLRAQVQDCCQSTAACGRSLTRHSDVDGPCTHSGTPGAVARVGRDWRPDGISGNQVDIVGLELILDLVDLPTANARRSGSKHAPGRARWSVPSPLAFYRLSLSG